MDNVTDTVVTSCSEGLDSSRSVQNMIGQHLLHGKETRPPLLSPFGMVPLAIRACMRETIDLEIGTKRERLLHIFGAAIAGVVSIGAIQGQTTYQRLTVDILQADQEVKLFDNFIKGLGWKGNSASKEQEDQDRNILHGASDCLKEAKDILDKLSIIKAIIMCQSSVLSDAFTYLMRLNKGKVRSAARHRSDTSRSRSRHEDRLSHQFPYFSSAPGSRQGSDTLEGRRRYSYPSRQGSKAESQTGTLSDIQDRLEVGSQDLSPDPSQGTSEDEHNHEDEYENEDKHQQEDKHGQDELGLHGGALSDIEDRDIPDEKLSVLKLIDYYQAYSKLDTITENVDKLLSDASQVRDNVGSANFISK